MVTPFPQCPSSSSFGCPFGLMQAIMQGHTPITHCLCSSPPPHTYLPTWVLAIPPGSHFPPRLCSSSPQGWPPAASQLQAQPSCPVLAGLAGPSHDTCASIEPHRGAPPVLSSLWNLFQEA